MPVNPLFPLERFDVGATFADLEDIRRANPQRYEMEQLSRICHCDVDAGEVVGVLEVPEEPWWARGHVPGRPLMPGVLMVECAAQVCSWFVRRVYSDAEYGERFFGFGGIDDVKFRGAVFPPATLVVLGRRHEIRTRRAVFDTQGYVDGVPVFEARITGMWV
jgi:3-hydroxyacyl-[acyl-carrier-protein] dehydratase